MAFKNLPANPTFSELQLYMEQDAPKTIGRMPVPYMETPDEYFWASKKDQEKYGLDEGGDPLGIDVMLSGVVEGTIGIALSDGFDDFSDDDTYHDSHIALTSIFGGSSFNSGW